MLQRIGTLRLQGTHQRYGGVALFDLDRKRARQEQIQVAVVGAGPAGVSAALTAVGAGMNVTLIDEHPIAMDVMAQDIPLFFGQRMLATTANRGLMLERVAGNNPLIAAAIDAGVDVKLGTTVWSSEPDGTLGLADSEHSWLLSYEYAVFATGARDLCFAFDGWEKAGVMGAGAALALMDRYQALSGRRIAVLGAGDLGLHVALRAVENGLDVAAIVDSLPAPQASPELLQRAEAAKIPIYASHTVRQAIGPDEVVRLQIGPTGNGASDGLKEIECDTVCLAIGMVPSAELMYWAGVDLSFEPSNGGFVPVLDENLRSTNEKIYVAGDAAGFTEGRFTDPEQAARQGARAGAAIAAASGAGAPADGDNGALGREDGDGRVAEIRRTWLDSLTLSRGQDTVVCLCEEVTRQDLLATVRRGAGHPDLLKRLTRAGMGHCQGRRCREQIQMIVSDVTDSPVPEVPLASYRPPFRPIPLSILANQDETEEERALYEGTTYDSIT